MIVSVFNIAENGRNKLRPYLASALSTPNDTNRDRYTRRGAIYRAREEIHRTPE